MQRYTTFISNNYRLLSFGLLLTLFSSFGQTFLISLYVPEIAATFQLSNTQISSLYASATLVSAFTLPWIGRYIDIWPLARFTTGVLIGMFLALLVLSFSLNPIMVLIGFWGLRLTGQALMGHTAVSTMARNYGMDRGKAISIANIGHPIGEAIFPLIIATSIGTFGWRIPLQFSAILVIVLVLPLALYLLKGTDPAVLFPQMEVADEKDPEAKLVRRPWAILGQWKFWVLFPGVIFCGMVVTAIFFFQIQLGASRGWTASWVAASIAAFAVGSALGMLLSGPWVDRLTAKRIFPYVLFPFLCGLLLLAFFEMPLIYPISLLFLGFSNGAGSSVFNSIYAEVFGTVAIGSVRSMFATAGVFGSAIGPISFGLFLDNQLSFSTILVIAAILCALTILWSFQVKGN